jgi:hypothetical protein
MKTEPRNVFLTRDEIALTRADGFFDGLDDLTVSNEFNGSLIDDRGIGWHNFL